MRSIHTAAFAALATLAAASTPFIAQAGATPDGTKTFTAYSNFGTGGAFSPSNFYFVSGPVSGAATYAAPFVAGASGALNHIDLPLQDGGRPSHGVVVSIYNDNGGVPGTYSDGAALEEWLDTKVPATATRIKFVSSRHPTLTAGSKYWVVVAPLFYDAVTVWYMNSTGVNGVDATFKGGWTGTWAPYTANSGVTPAFDVWVQ